MLRTDHPQSLRSFVRLMGLPLCWDSFQPMDYTVQTGRPALNKVFPGGIWNFLSEHPEESRLFDEGMKGKAQAQIAGVVANYDFSGFSTIGDIGGGRGHLLQAVLAAAPKAKGVLFDQPHVVEQAALATDRLRLQGGDFFKDALPACDGYLIMQVIHDWSDQEAAQILNAIRRAASPGAKLLLIEGRVPADATPSWLWALDLFMMTMLTGKERTEREYQQLLSSAGFRLDRVIDVGMKTAIHEAVAV